MLSNAVSLKAAWHCRVPAAHCRTDWACTGQFLLCVQLRLTGDLKPWPSEKCKLWIPNLSNTHYQPCRGWAWAGKPQVWGCWEILDAGPKIQTCYPYPTEPNSCQGCPIKCPKHGLSEPWQGFLLSHLAFYSSALFSHVLQAKLHLHSPEPSAPCCTGELWSCKDILMGIL